MVAQPPVRPADPLAVLAVVPVVAQAVVVAQEMPVLPEAVRAAVPLAVLMVILVVVQALVLAVALEVVRLAA